MLLEVSASPHQPYEGSQPWATSHAPSTSMVLISPTRVRNRDRHGRSVPTYTGPHQPYEGSQREAEFDDPTTLSGPHQPYEGSQRGAGGEGVNGGSTCPHQPYEGSQHERARPRTRTGPAVLISPTRVRNVCSQIRSRSRPRVRNSW